MFGKQGEKSVAITVLIITPIRSVKTGMNIIIKAGIILLA
jgi:hypothetical protein